MKNLLIAAALFGSSFAFAQAEEGEDKAKPENASGNPEENAGPDVAKLPFTPDSIRLVMSHNQPKIQACYEDLMAADEKVVEGKLMTSFTITREGLVKKPKVLKKGTTLRNPKLHDCVVAVLASMNFPRPHRPQPIEYPINLKAIK